MSKKEFAVGQKVRLADAVEQARFVSQLSPQKTFNEGATGWICNGGFMLCNGYLLRLDAEKVTVNGFDAEAVTEYLWDQLTHGYPDTTLVHVDWEYFSKYVESALWHLNFPVPRISEQPAEITFDDLSKHQFWQDRQDLFREGTQPYTLIQLHALGPGAPVFAITKDNEYGWALLDYKDDRLVAIRHLEEDSDKAVCLHEDDYGITWRAYRKDISPWEHD